MEPNDEVKLGQLSPYRTIKPGEKFKYEGGILPIGSFLGEIKIGYGVVIEEASVFYGNNFIGHNVVVRPRCIIGKYSELRVNSWLAEGVTIGEHSVIYNYANIAMGLLSAIMFTSVFTVLLRTRMILFSTVEDHSFQIRLELRTEQESLRVLPFCPEW
jgi:NDP-sugar pyrophosphorylase family protein